MSDLAPSDRLDIACLDFVNTFSTDPIDGVERNAQVRHLQLSLGMSVIAVMYRDQVQQQRYFEERDNNAFQVLGNPSANIRTWDPDGNMAYYNFDRSTGLVAVNRFKFPGRETRPVSDRRKQALANSIAGGGFVLHQALTPRGINRISEDLERVVAR